MRTHWRPASRENRLFAAAMHEAGHAIARLVLGGPAVRHLQVFDDAEGIGGEVGMDMRWDPELADLYERLRGNPWEATAMELARADVLDLMAGGITECRSEGSSWRAVRAKGKQLVQAYPFANDDPESDLSAIRPRLDYLGGKQASERFVQEWSAASLLVNQRWALVEELGHWLLRERRLDGGAVDAWWHAKAVNEPGCERA